jgi:hypothetical protein
LPNENHPDKINRRSLSWLQSAVICRLAAQNFFFSSILVHHMGQFKLCYYLNWNRVLFRHPECTCRCSQLHMDIRPRCASTCKSSKTRTSLSCVKLHMQIYIYKY